MMAQVGILAGNGRGRLRQGGAVRRDDGTDQDRPATLLDGLRALPRDVLRERLRAAVLRVLPFSPPARPRAYAAPRLLPPDPWPGDAAAGQRLLDGTFVLAGQRIVDPMPFWRPSTASPDWLRDLHSFAWLRDLRALGGDAARRFARDRVEDWLQNHRGTRGLPGEAVVVARRLSHWFGQYDFFASSADVIYRERLLTAARRQTAWLALQLPAGLRGADLTCGLRGLIFAGACLPDGDPWLEQGLDLLVEALPHQILPDGGHVERSPARHVAALRDLIDLRSVLHAAGRPPLDDLDVAIESMAPVLRLFLHGDGGLAHFNGSNSEDPDKIALVLQRVSRRRPRQTAPQSGFQRVQHGRALLLVDAGVPAPPDCDRQAHAGTLSLELGVGRERLIVNCGSQQGGPWRDLLRGTAAHSTLCLAETNSSHVAPASDWGPGLFRRPEKVTCRREALEDGTLLELSHDGYLPLFGLIHQRRLLLSAAGDSLLGEDALITKGQPPEGAVAFAIRFHLHPGVQAALSAGTVLLRLPRGGGWRLRCEGAVAELDDSVYFGTGRPQRSSQIVLHGHHVGEDLCVRWLLQREAPNRGAEEAAERDNRLQLD